MSTLLLRTLLLTCATAGALAVACGEDTPSSSNDESPSSKDDDDDDDDEDDDAPRRDAGRNGRSDAGRRDAGRDSSAPPSTGGLCPSPVMTCMTADNRSGFALCDRTTGEFGECRAGTGGGGVAGDGGMNPPCPDGFTCTALGPISFCAMGMTPPMCTTTEECADQGLPNAMCRMLQGMGFCQQACSAGGTGTPTPTPRGDGGTPTIPPIPGLDAGGIGIGRDAGRDAR